MIQRIQSIFLLLAAGAGFGLLALPFATTPENVVASALFSDANYAVNDNLGLTILFALAGVLALAGIFTFKNRPLQLKICRFALVTDIIGLVLAIILLWQDSGNIGAADINDGGGAYLPIGYVVMVVLALRFIQKDEKLVKSMDRLR